jgi:hypothetical protein
MASMYDTILKAIGPKEAEAEVVYHDPYVKRLAEEITAAQATPMSQTGVMQSILKMAEQRPETVSVAVTPMQSSSLAGYRPYSDSIVMNSAYTRPMYPNRPESDFSGANKQTLSHELMHFLMSKTGKELFKDFDINKAQDFQHKIIEYVLGPQQRVDTVGQYLKQGQLPEHLQPRTFDIGVLEDLAKRMRTSLTDYKRPLSVTDDDEFSYNESSRSPITYGEAFNKVIQKLFPQQPVSYE